MTQVSIIIADDHPIFRNGLATIIREEKNFVIMQEAINGNDAIEAILLHQPQIAILDIKMPNKTGIEVVKVLAQHKLPTKFIFLTMYKEEEWFRKAMELGVHGYVLKECAIDDIIDCIYAVSEGHHYISPVISSYLVEHGKKSNQMDNSGIDNLTATERKVLLFIADKLSSKNIAEKMNISVRTVENHRNNICLKLNIHGPNSLLKFALDNRGFL